MTSKKSIALVTGASRGIGASSAKVLASRGFHVVLNYSSNEAKAKAVLDEILASGGSGSLMGFDISDSKQVDAKFDEILKTLGPVSVLVNNAGMTVDGLLLRLKDEDLDRVLNVNLKGTIYCTRAAAKQMMKSRAPGSIIQISSVVGESGNAGQASYTAAKSGVIGFSKTVAKELGSRQIRVNVITPGFIKTDMTEGLTDAQKEDILRSIPLGTLGSPEDVAHVVAFLASPESKYVTGQVIGVNGGMYM